MRRSPLPLFAVLLSGCGQGPAKTTIPDSAGARLETAAQAAGLVADPNAPLEGYWARDTDRVCVVGTQRTNRIGVSVDYGEDQTCAASGTVERTARALKIKLGTCAFDARSDGDRIIFPAELPEACDLLCSGRASLAALSVDRVSESRSEASTLRSTKGRLLCAD